MTANCPTCEGSGDNGMSGPEQETCPACDGTGRIEGTREELCSILRWGASIVLLVLHTLLEVIR